MEQTGTIRSVCHNEATGVVVGGGGGGGVGGRGGGWGVNKVQLQAYVMTGEG